MKIAFKLILWVKKADKDGNAPVAIRITGGNKVAYHNTGIKIPPAAWDGSAVTKAAPNHDIKNLRLSKLVKDMEREVLNRELQSQEIDVSIVKSLFRSTPEKGRSFYTYASRLIADKKESTKKRYTVEVNKIKEYAGNSLMFGEITAKWLTAYYKYLTTEKGEKRANHNNTAINAFKVIRHVFNAAIEENIIDKSLHPFTGWKYPQYKAPVRTFLTLQECDRIYDLLNDSSVEQEIKIVAAFFLLEAFSGIRVSDWNKFRIETITNKEEMVFTTTKTGTDVRLPLDLMPSLKKIVKYITDNDLKFTYTGVHANRQLKVIAKMAKIDKTLKTHIARHTFATLSLAIGLPPAAIGMAMGITTRQVETYAKVSPDILRMSLTRIGGGL